MNKSRLLLGLAGTGCLLTTLLIAGTNVAYDNEGIINDVLNLSTSKIASSKRSDYAENDGSLSDEGWRKMIKDSYRFCEEEEEQGSVLLKNDGALPLAQNERRVTLFGQAGPSLFMRSGAGGAAPNDSLVVGLDRAFTENGFTINETVWNAYYRYTGTNKQNPDTNYEAEISLYTDAIKKTFDDYNQAAIVTFMRVGTENNDPNAGMLDMHANERALLQMIKDSGKFAKIIVLINSPMPMSLDWVDQEAYGINAVMWIGVPGYYGLGGMVHCLTGEANPSGHTPDTFATHANSSPAYVNFGNSNFAVYKEGIYVGYKYYETRYEDAVLDQGNAKGVQGVFDGEGNWDYSREVAYPFGYGLSYTTFEQKITDINYNAQTDQYEVKVSVKNTGEIAGRSSVQVYVQQPYTDYDKTNGLEKSAIALMGYDKILVEPGETKETTVKFDRYFLATYDYKLAKTYVLEGGDYYFAIGNGAHEAINNVLGLKAPAANLVDHLGNAFTPNADGVRKITIEGDANTYKYSHYNSNVPVTNQFDDADYNYYAVNNKITYLTRQDWEGTWPTKTTTDPDGSNVSAARNMANKYSKPADSPSYAAGDGTVYNVQLKDAEGNNTRITFHDMADVPFSGKIEKGKFAGQDADEVWKKFISQMTLNDLAISVSDNRGLLAVSKVKKPGNSVAEGPEGLLSRFQFGDNRWATGFATGPVYTATWDHEMQAKFGAFYGEEALFCGVASVNAPGANINRTPYGSRASEYMSEDGVLNYNVAANIIGAARKKGLIMNIKHCFLNNQEDGRQRIATFCNEQAIREIYLRPFEGALTKGEGLGIMTSYNRIGLTYAACHDHLMQNVMRKEWDYKGFIIDDALTGSNTDQYSNGPSMLYCGTDMFCLDGSRGSQLTSYITQNDDGTLLECMQRANKHIMYALNQSWMGDADAGDAVDEAIEANLNPWWKQLITGIDIGVSVLTGAAAILYVLFAFVLKDKGDDKEPASAE